MSKLTATFNGLEIKIEGVGNVTFHQLYIASRMLESDGWLTGAPTAGGAPMVAIEFNGLDAKVVAYNTSYCHRLALAGELFLGAQLRFMSQQQMAAAQAVQNQIQMAQIQRTMKGDGLVLPPRG